MPIWVRLYNLPLNCWGVDALSRMGSLVSKPVCADEATSQQSRVGYTRLLIEVDLTKPLVEVIQLQQVNGKIFTQKVHFEWKPLLILIVFNLDIDVRTRKLSLIRGGCLNNLLHQIGG